MGVVASGVSVVHMLCFGADVMDLAMENEMCVCIGAVCAATSHDATRHDMEVCSRSRGGCVRICGFIDGVSN
jgi:hypothetical protein